MNELIDIMSRLRDPEAGCSWDIAQSFDTIAPYTIEEAYEVHDAIEKKDLAALKDELGDLLLQVVFHSQIAKELGAFTIDDVMRSICDKMIRRHPHIFSDVDDNEVDWERMKEAEREEIGQSSALDGVASALPALMRAQKLQKRAARTGFDWDNADDCVAKLEEEIEELKQAQNDNERAQEAGDLLFAAVNVVRHFDIDAETALRAGNDKFTRRFKQMEALSQEEFANLSLAEKEALWQKVKSLESSD